MTRLLRLWNRSVAAQTFMLVCAALFTAQALTFWSFCGIRAGVLREAAKDGFERDLVLIAQQLEAGAWDDAGAPLARFGTAERFFWVTDARPEGVPPTAPHEVRHRLHHPASPLERLVPPAFAEAGPASAVPPGPLRWLGARRGSAVELAVHPSDQGYVGTIALASGARLNGLFVTPAWTSPLVAQNWSALALTVAAMMAVSVPLARRLTLPMRRLAAAANEVGQGRRAELAVAGPAEVAGAARAFNEMQGRIARLIEDRTHMLSAIGHDLRTPLTSARLRAHLVEDDDLREPLLGDLDGVEAICESALGLVRGLEDEPVEAVDVAALARSVCAEFAARGVRASCAAGPVVEAIARPVMLRRALANLVENAVVHGGGASVRVSAQDGAVRVLVEDEGPGLPEDAIEALFLPFRRLERSRSRATGGTGLGLTLVRSIARRHGGEATLQNRTGGPGLAAELRLPSR